MKKRQFISLIKILTYLYLLFISVHRYIEWIFLKRKLFVFFIGLQHLSKYIGRFQRIIFFIAIFFLFLIDFYQRIRFNELNFVQNIETTILTNSSYFYSLFIFLYVLVRVLNYILRSDFFIKKHFIIFYHPYQQFIVCTNICNILRLHDFRSEDIWTNSN